MVDTILVTGVPELLEAKLYDDFPKSRKVLLELQFTLQIKLILKQIVDQWIEFVNLDYLESKTVHEPLANVQNIFLITIPSPNSVNIVSNLVKEAKKNGIKYIVKLSVMNADAQPGYAMGKLHRQEEKIIEESKISHTFLLPTSFIQNFVNYLVKP